MVSIESFILSTDFSPRQGLDFLDTKNKLLLSYLIDLVLYIRNRLQRSSSKDSSNLRRLREMRTVLDKVRNLDKKLRYQIDKLLSLQVNVTSFATGDDSQEDPLQFKPIVDQIFGDDEGGGEELGSDGEDAKDDDDLAAARQAIRLTQSKRFQQDTGKTKTAEVYRPPRLAATPYNLDLNDRQTEHEKRQRQRARTSELAQALRSQYGEAPELEDIHGGSEMGKQREAARRMMERQEAKTKYEEDTMVRLTTSRKEKKERQRLMRAEQSNLSALSDLGSLVRDAGLAKPKKDRRIDSGGEQEGISSSSRHANGRRKRQMMDSDGRVHQHKKQQIQAKNALQEELFIGGKTKGKKRKK